MNNNLHLKTQDKILGDFISRNVKLDNLFVQSLLNCIQSGVIIVDENSKVITCNNNILNVFECENLEALVSKFENTIVRSNAQNSIKNFEFAVSQAIKLGKYDTDSIEIDGASIPFVASFIRLDTIDETSNLILILLQSKDLSSISTNKALDEQISNFKAIIDANPLCLNVWNRNMENLMCNKQAVVLFGLENEEQYLSDFMKLSPLFQPNGLLSSELAKQHVEKAFSEGINVFRWLHQDLDGEEIPAEITLTKIKLAHGEDYVAGYTRDLRPEFLGTENDKQYENYFLNRISDRTLLNCVAELSNEWFFALDTRTSVIQYYGKSVTDGGNANGISVKLDTALKKGMIHKDDENLYVRLMVNMKKGVYEPIDIRYLDSSDSYRYFRMIYQAVRDLEGKPIFIVGKALDIHEQKLLEERTKIDLLTGCYNKITAENAISEKLIIAKEKKHALFIIDIDNFKAVNDNIGHFFGDEVLKEVSGSLKSSFRNHDVVARIGGDEFVVFVENIVDEKVLEKKAKKILEVFYRTYSGDYRDYKISGSIGIALYPSAGVTYTDLYKSADKALYEAKNLGKNQFVFYSEALVTGTTTNITRLDNANRMVGSYFDYDLISAIFEIIYERNGDSVSLNSALRYICQKYSADRCYIFETFDKGETYSNTYEWCRQGISEEKDNLQSSPKELYKDLFDAARDGIVFSNDIESTFTSDVAYKLMAEQDIKSFVHAQVRKEGHVTFFIGLDDCTKARVWSEKEINTLQYISKVISIVLQGVRLRDELREVEEYNVISAFVSDHANDVVYISDTDTYELLYINKACVDALGNPPESAWMGKPCYKILQGKDSPCEFCTNHLLSEESFYEWTFFNEGFGKKYFLRDKLIPMKGKLVRLEIATDISDISKLETELKEKLEDERLLVSCIETLHSGESPQSSIGKLLKIIAKFHKAERCYIFEISDCGIKINNTYEWCEDGIVSQIQNLKNVDKAEVADWFEMYEECGQFTIDSINDEIDTNSKQYQILKEQGIKSLVTTALKDSNGEIAGFIGVDNPTENINKTELLASVTKFIANFLDETKLLNELSKLSYYDTLTNIKNRHSYRMALKEIDKLSISSLGVVYVDISGLSAINEVEGTEFGDEVIIKMANILHDIFGKDCFRVGGDEFVGIRKNTSELEFEKEIKLLKDKISNQHDFRASVGYTWNRNIDDGKVINESIGGSKYSAILANNLDMEISDGKYVVYMQPQVDIQTGLLDGAEALIRRVGADGFVQPPISFLPFYEKEGIISKIDLFVVETVCSRLSSWREQGYKPDFKVSVNCSRMTISEKSIVEKFAAICDKYKVNRSQIIIEITETINGVCDEILAEIITNFTKEGFSVSLDDFGSGYSNLSALLTSDFNELKIDMSLIRNLGSNRKSRALTKAALNMCDDLEDLVTVAEGIEYVEQYDVLKQLKCKKGQGYYFDKPLAVEEFEIKYILN